VEAVELAPEWVELEARTHKSIGLGLSSLSRVVVVVVVAGPVGLVVEAEVQLSLQVLLME
jgi:hypothetical protein